MVTKTIFTIFSSSNERWRYDITSMDVTELQSIRYFFSRNLLLPPSSRPVLYSHGLISEHMPYRKSKSGLRTFTPACQFTSILPKLQTLHSLFSTQSTGYQHFKYSSDNSIMNWVWATTGLKLVGDIWYVRNASKWLWTTVLSQSLNSISVLTHNNRKICIWAT